MGTGNKNAKSQLKNIRFPYEVLEEIETSIEREKQVNEGANFSAWVLDACGRKLKAEQRKQGKQAEPETAPAAEPVEEKAPAVKPIKARFIGAKN